MRRREEGQILVMFAAVVIVLIGISAVVVDIGMKYSFERRYQSIADSASLAGAQELKPITRTAPVTLAMQSDARAEALGIALTELTGAATDPTCPVILAATDIDCPVAAGRYRVVIKTPAPRCVDCDVNRAVQVTVDEPAFSTNFSRLFGQTTWDLQRTSVAGLSFGKNYTIVTLRPPQPVGRSGGFDVRDIRIEGGTHVVVSRGDVGSNSNMEYGGSGSKLYLDTEYNMYYFDPINPPQWTPPSPADPTGKKLGSMILDPGYVIPAAPVTNIGSIATEVPGSPCLSAATSLVAAASPYKAYLPVSSPTVPNMTRITCLLPGYFPTDPLTSSIQNDAVILLNDPAGHGLYYFGGGFDVQNSLIGGYTAASPGVAIVLPQNQEMNVNTGGGGGTLTAIALNAGTKFGTGSGVEASPALDFNNLPIVTNGPTPNKLTLMVTRDPACTPVAPYPSCPNDNANDTIKIAGNSVLYLAGVQFMPSDNSSINSSASTGYIGQIWAWTLKYAGGVVLNQEGTAAEGAGILRIDTACSPGVVPICNQ